MEKKQTAVEWFLSEFENQIQFKPDSELDVWFKALFPKAKQMEKEQIEIAFNIGEFEGVIRSDKRNGTDYYNETYGGRG
jgi:hypothetical protein